MLAVRGGFNLILEDNLKCTADILHLLLFLSETSRVARYVVADDAGSYSQFSTKTCLGILCREQLESQGLRQCQIVGVSRQVDFNCHPVSVKKYIHNAC